MPPSPGRRNRWLRTQAIDDCSTRCYATSTPKPTRQPTAAVGPDGSTGLTFAVSVLHNASPKPVPLLSDILDGVERGAKRVGRPVAIVLDEFQDVVERGGIEAEGQIRAAVQRHKHVGYVFAGSKTRLTVDMTSPGRPFYNLGDREFVGPVPRQCFCCQRTGAADA